MAANKNQHFVPKCHFRPFSKDGEGQAINIFNIKRQISIYDASISDQCSKDYFYGKDLRLENILKDIEGRYSTVVRAIESGDHHLSNKAITTLRNFSILQYLRTAKAVKRVSDANADLINAAFDRPADKERRPDDLTKEELLHLSLFSAAEDLINDLKFCLCVNRTKFEFITSDDPAIHTNKYHIQRLGTTVFGFKSAGALLMIPVTPNVYSIFYDGGCYTIPDKKELSVEVVRPVDVMAFNELQVINSWQNLFFRDRNQSGSVAEAFERHAPQRISTWTTTNQLVEIEPGVYRQGSPEEIESARALVVHQQPKFPVPTSWPSFIKFRNPPRVDNTGTAAGIIRRGVSLDRR